jgi:uncharacterized protein YcfL
MKRLFIVIVSSFCLVACSKSKTSTNDAGSAAPAQLSWDQGNWNQTNWQ